MLLFLVGGSGALTRSSTEAFTDAEWIERAIPGTNPPGFTAWHMARTLDWAVQCGVRGVAEVASRPAYAALGVEFGVGIGIAPEDAMSIARRMSRRAVAEYADSVTAESLRWLKSADEEELSRPTDLARNQAAFPVYRGVGHLEEVHDLLEIPNWMLILRPATSHIRVHRGELEVMAEAFHNS